MNDQVNIRLIAIENYSHDKAEKLKELQTQVETLQEFNKNAEKVLSRLDTSLEELEKLQSKVLKNTNDIYALKLWKNEVIARLDQGIENRTKAFERIELLEKQVSMLKNLLDQYFTLEINQIKESHAKRK
tara:strand:+ start:13092 stop:13481 length:390 start_codon:yes stop_codon:yes gene_type:complete